jgi:NADH:ubiquinone oxidoreductase subunit H
MINLLEAILIFIGLLLAVAFSTVSERKFLATMQRRRGPEVVGF